MLIPCYSAGSKMCKNPRLLRAGDFPVVLQSRYHSEYRAFSSSVNRLASHSDTPYTIVNSMTFIVSPFLFAQFQRAFFRPFKCSRYKLIDRFCPVNLSIAVQKQHLFGQIVEWFIVWPIIFPIRRSHFGAIQV